MTEFTDRTVELAPGGGLSIASVDAFGEDGLGEIYIVDRASTTTGEVYKIIPVTDLPDFNCDGQVGISDFLAMLEHWGICPTNEFCVWDLDGDGEVGIVDFLALLGLWS